MHGCSNGLAKTSRGGISPGPKSNWVQVGYAVGFQVPIRAGLSVQTHRVHPSPYYSGGLGQAVPIGLRYNLVVTIWARSWA